MVRIIGGRPALVTTAYYPWRKFELVAGPGLEIASDLDTEFVMRLGAGNRFPVGQFEVGPDFNVDLDHGDPTDVFGVSASIRFGYEHSARVSRSIESSSRGARALRW